MIAMKSHHIMTTTSLMTQPPTTTAARAARIIEEPAPEPSVEEDGHSVAAQPARVSESFGKSVAKVIFETSDYGRIAVYENTNKKNFEARSGALLVAEAALLA